MKTKLVICYWLLPFIACCQIQNDIIIEKTCVNYSIETEKDIFTTCSTIVYTVYNIGNSIVWLWFEKKDNLSEEKKLKDYFFGIKSDISLFHILTDANVNVSNDFSPTLFYSFLKYINPHDSFKIQLSFSKELSDMTKKQIFDYLDKYLVLVSNEKLTKYVGLPKLEQLNQSVLYKEDFIVLPTHFVNF
jgi:hypothetical protein